MDEIFLINDEYVTEIWPLIGPSTNLTKHRNPPYGTNKHQHLARRNRTFKSNALERAN